MDSSHSWRCRDKGQLSRQSDINPNRVAIDPITPITVYSITGTRGNGTRDIVTTSSAAAMDSSGGTAVNVLVIRLIIKEHPGGQLATNTSIGSSTKINWEQQSVGNTKDNSVSI